MRIIKDHSIGTDDWVRLADDAPLPVTGDVIVSYARWSAEVEVLRGRAGRVGICLAPDDDVTDIVAHLARFELVAIDFPTFGDGRGYSQARLLRDAYGFGGELRAVGDVLRDQLDFMARCGFDSFEIRADQDPAQALEAFNEFSVRYQPAADGVPPIWTLR